MQPLLLLYVLLEIFCCFTTEFPKMLILSRGLPIRLRFSFGGNPVAPETFIYLLLLLHPSSPRALTPFTTAPIYAHNPCPAKRFGQRSLSELHGPSGDLNPVLPGPKSNTLTTTPHMLFPGPE